MGSNVIEPEMVHIPAGRVILGCVEGRDVERYCVDGLPKPSPQLSIAAFKMGKTEVTFDEWDACTKAGVCIRAEDVGWGRGKRPVINVSWNDIQTYIRWLNQQTGKRYKLPLEEQWEYAARANSNTRYPWGNESNCRLANYGGQNKWECDTDRTKPVASYKANDFGLYDTAGNVGYTPTKVPKDPQDFATSKP